MAMGIPEVLHPGGLDPKTKELLDKFGADLKPSYRRRVQRVRQHASSLLSKHGRPNVHLLPIDPKTGINLETSRYDIRIRPPLIGGVTEVGPKKQEGRSNAVAVLIEKARQFDPLQPFRAIARLRTDAGILDIQAEWEKSAQLAWQCLKVTPLKELIVWIPVGPISDSRTLIIYSWEPSLMDKINIICNSPAGTVDANPDQFSRWRLEDCHIRFTATHWGYRRGTDEHYLEVHPRLDYIAATKSHKPHSILRRIQQAELFTQLAQSYIDDFQSRHTEHLAE